MLSFRDSAETTEKGATVLYLVTEPVKPLKLVLQELDLQGQHRCAVQDSGACVTTLLGPALWGCGSAGAVAEDGAMEEETWAQHADRGGSLGSGSGLHGA